MIIINALVRIVAMNTITELSTGSKVLNFTVANNRYCSGEAATDTFSVTAFAKTAEFIGKNFKVGQLIMINGTLINNHYKDKNGNIQYSEKIVANAVDFAGYNKSDITQEEKENE